MNTSQGRTNSHPIWAALALTAALGCTSALAGDKTSHSSNAQRYQQERAACMNGQTNQSRADCLREAGAAFNEAEKGRLVKVDADFEANQKLRCQPLPAEERQDCMARMTGQGSVTGSVEAGGVYRELKTVEPVPQK
jgi:hypothetical protein